MLDEAVFFRDREVVEATIDLDEWHGGRSETGHLKLLVEEVSCGASLALGLLRFASCEHWIV